MSNKKKILVFIDWYIPGYKAGGQIRSCGNMVPRLKKYFDFTIITRDKDLNAEKSYDGIASDTKTTVHDDVAIYYLSDKMVNYGGLKQIIDKQEYDAIYLNSFFSFYFSILPLFIIRKLNKNTPIVLATSGMLSEQALSIKPLKKKLFIAFIKLIGFYKNIYFVASSKIEEADIKKTMGYNTNISIGPNLPTPDLPEIVVRSKNVNHLKLVYLSRIHPIKNLDKVLDYISKVDSKNKIDFDIFGPVEDEAYWSDCKQQIAKLPKNINCKYHGVLAHEKIAGTYMDYHFSILPSESENFGYSIVESFMTACPVFISDKTPWQKLEDRNAGFDLSLSQPDSFVAAISKACEMSEVEYSKWQEGARNYAKEIIEDKERTEQNKQIFDLAV